jgi:hypothetical protein
MSVEKPHSSNFNGKVSLIPENLKSIEGATSYGKALILLL